jgi:hypothetical protein
MFCGLGPELQVVEAGKAGLEKKMRPGKDGAWKRRSLTS